jgi:alpha-tubulin suppressor-like RCC1 family protein
VPHAFLFRDLAADAAFFFGLQGVACVLRDAHGAIWPNSAAIAAALADRSAPDDAPVLHLDPLSFNTATAAAATTAPLAGPPARTVTTPATTAETPARPFVPEPFVTPARDSLFTIEKRRTDDLFRLPERSLLFEERPIHAAPTTTTTSASTASQNGDVVAVAMGPPAAVPPKPARSVFMLAFGGKVHRTSVPDAARLPTVSLLHRVVIDSAGAPFEYRSASSAGDGSWLAADLPGAVAGASGGLKALASTDQHVFALTGDGLLYRWPLAPSGALAGAAALPRPVARDGGGADSMRFQSLSCGATMALAVTGDGQVWRVGRELDGVPRAAPTRPGQLDGADDAANEATWLDDDDERALAVSHTPSSSVGSLLLAVRVPLPASVRVARVACGEGHRLLLTTGGSVYAFGDGKNGRLGLGDERSSATPRCIVSLAARRFVDISAGAYHSAAVSDDGRLFTWGQGKYGQLGHGSQNNEILPREVAAISHHRIVACVASTMYTAALTINGDVYTCGFPMTPAEDAAKYSGAVLSSSPRLALSGMQITQLGTSNAGALFALPGTIAGLSNATPLSIE